MARRKKNSSIQSGTEQGRYRSAGQNAVNRKYKDTVFRKLFSSKRALLSLYNAVHGTYYDNPDDLQIETLDNAVYMKIKNDVSFVFQARLELYEHQATVNINLPLRNLFYVSDVLKKITENHDLHLHSPQYIPTPEFIVFYNGAEQQPAKRIFRLSELFEVPTSSPQLELIVTQININPGYNPELLERCRELYGYSAFVSKIRSRTDGGESIEDAVSEAIDECIKEGILEEFLRREKAEVKAMSIYEYDEEWHLANLRAEARKEGREEGLAAGREEGLIAGREEERANTLRERARAETAEAIIREYRAKYGELSPDNGPDDGAGFTKNRETKA